MIQIAPNGTAMTGDRIGERRNGVLISTADMSDGEIEKAGLLGIARPASEDANRLYGPSSVPPPPFDQEAFNKWLLSTL